MNNGRKIYPRTKIGPGSGFARGPARWIWARMAFTVSGIAPGTVPHRFDREACCEEEQIDSPRRDRAQYAGVLIEGVVARQCC